jgi:hypothetical protein
MNLTEEATTVTHRAKMQGDLDLEVVSTSSDKGKRGFKGRRLRLWQVKLKSWMGEF